MAEYAHIVAPHIYDNGSIDHDHLEGAAEQMAAHHFARAWGFYLAVEAHARGEIVWPDAASFMLLDLEIALLYTAMGITVGTGDDAAVEITATLANPEMIKHRIGLALAALGINTDDIKPYAPREATR